MQLIAVYLHVYNCLVIIIEYKLALHAMTLMGGAAASETLIRGYISTIGRCSTPQKQPRENAGCRYVYDVDETAFYDTLCFNIIIHKIMEAICTDLYSMC